VDGPSPLRWCRDEENVPVTGTSLDSGTGRDGASEGVRVDTGGVTSRLRLEPRPTSVSEARRLVRRTLLDAGCDHLVEPAVLATSELVTNALVHAGTPIEVGVEMLPEGVRVEIADGSRHLPVRRAYGAAAGTGRGLVTVASLVDSWGVRREGALGKVVWFEVGTSGGRVVDQLSGGGPGPDSPDGVVQVRLLGVPLLVHAAWQPHVEAMLREYLLTTLDEGTGEEAITLHAEASDALALLAEHLPKPDIGEGLEQMMAVALDPARSSADVTVPVPAESVPHFASLGRALDAAIVASAGNVFLTPPTQPELQTFRRWVCRQVEEQSRGASPEPWRIEEIATWKLSPSPPGWDPDVVSTSHERLVATDDTNTIIAVSPAAATLLGYAEPGMLVGRRLVAIVPPRYRQAHLAGFTLHLYAGRREIIDHSTRLHALRQDGTEVCVELLVRASPMEGERTVYVASLTPVES
jgi:PAS domain S-box-containing protein